MTTTIEAPVAAPKAPITARQTGVRNNNGHVTTNQRVITPEMAAAMLKQNIINRPLSDSHVKMLAREMAEGRWKFNGDTIRFAHGVLIDGQHRLAACVSSGASFRAIIVDGLDETVFDTIDTGRNRSAGDTLALQGEQNPTKLAATLRFVGSLLSGAVGHKLRLTTTEVEAVLKNHPKVRDSVKFCTREGKLLLPFPILAGCHYVFSQLDPLMADKAVDQLITGKGSYEQFHSLRERLVQNQLRKHKLTQKYIAALTIKSWNAVRSGRVVRNLGWRGAGKNPEEFPVAA